MIYVFFFIQEVSQAMSAFIQAMSWFNIAFLINIDLTPSQIPIPSHDNSSKIDFWIPISKLIFSIIFLSQNICYSNYEGSPWSKAHDLTLHLLNGLEEL